jgi:hypothetical protein
MTNWWREPVLHFLLLGAGLFALDGWWSRSSEPSSANRIHLDNGRLEQLREGFRRQHHRDPDTAELRELVDVFLREEVLYREALALGLDREDAIVRRRLAQKMEFLTADLVQSATPDDAALQRFVEAHSERYASPMRFTFRHVYFSAEKRGAAAAEQARTGVAALAGGAAEDMLGDGFLHGFEFQEFSTQDVASLFGREFADGLVRVALGGWQGPLPSSYGFHAVQVSARIPGRAPELSQVRDQVERDYREEQRLRANRELLARLLQRYVIDIDEPSLRTPAPAPSTPAATP